MFPPGGNLHKTTRNMNQPPGVQRGVFNYGRTISSCQMRWKSGRCIALLVSICARLSAPWWMVCTTIHNYLRVKQQAKQEVEGLRPIQSQPALFCRTLVVSPRCVLMLVRHHLRNFCCSAVVFWGVGQAGRGGGGVGVMECRPGAVKLQIDAGLLINARAHPPRLVEAWQLYW